MRRAEDRPLPRSAAHRCRRRDYRPCTGAGWRAPPNVEAGGPAGSHPATHAAAVAVAAAAVAAAAVVVAAADLRLFVPPAGRSSQRPLSPVSSLLMRPESM